MGRPMAFPGCDGLNLSSPRQNSSLVSSNSLWCAGPCFKGTHLNLAACRPRLCSCSAGHWKRVSCQRSFHFWAQWGAMSDEMLLVASAVKSVVACEVLATGQTSPGSSVAPGQPLLHFDGFWVTLKPARL
jgi:hypothetical protein